MKTSNLKTSAIATIQNSTTRKLLFAALYQRYGLWEESFNVTKNGKVLAKAAWWRARRLWKNVCWIEIHAYCKGWLDARSDKQVLAAKRRLCQPTG